MSDTARKPRPEYRNIGITDITLKYRLPPAAKLSILHRVSGAGLFLFLPFLLYLFSQSLTSELSFMVLRDFFGNIIVKLIVLGLAWAFLFHFCAGIRHIVMDLNHNLSTKETGKKTAIVVFIISTLLTLAVAAKLFGAF